MSRRPEAESEDCGPGTRGDLMGRLLGAYRVVGRLGAGGMGEVYEVEHELLGRRFALKVLRADIAAGGEARARFRREPRAAAKLVSEHVVSIIDTGDLDDGTPYFVMERLYGSDLRRLLDEQRVLPVARAVHLAIDACRGLACAHRQGLIHRDLKPENLFVTTREDGQDLCKLLDFGVVKWAHDNTTQPGAIIGTTRYLAPEQVGLERPLSAQSDLFSLAVILYECLTGQSPFDGDTVERVLFKIMTERETPIRALRPEVPAELEALIARALEKDPAARPASALSLAKELSKFVRPGDREPTFSNWRLDVASPALESPASRELTPRFTAAGPRRSFEELADEPRARPGSKAALFLALSLGVALGGGGALLAVHPASGEPAEEQRKPLPAAAPTALPATGAAPANEPAQMRDTSADTTTPATPAPSSSTAAQSLTAAPRVPAVARRAAPASNVAPVRSGPPLTYDPENPYAK